MLAISGHDGVERVYFELSRHPEWLWPRDPRSNMPEGLAEDLFALCEDVATTVWLLIVWQEERVATDFVQSVDVDGVVADFLRHAGSREEAKQLLAEEVDGLIEKASQFDDRLQNMIDNGVIVNNERVRRHCTENLSRMQDAWKQYRTKLQAVIGPW